MIPSNTPAGVQPPASGPTPSDDDEPWTLEWLHTLPQTHCLGWGCVDFYPQRCETAKTAMPLTVRFYDFRSRAQTAEVAGSYLVPCCTKGDVRRLLKALGVAP